MRRELLVALLFVLFFHFFNRFANDWPYRVKPPRAFGASPPLKILSFHPYQFAAHRYHGTPRSWRGLRCYERRAGIRLPRHCVDKRAFSLVLREVLRTSTAALGTPTKTEVHTQGARD
jgi:hypothetical protein